MGDLDAAVLDRLGRERNAWLCTNRPDGSSHVTPIWFVFRKDTWWIGSSERNVKVRNIEREPRVSLALEDGDRPVVAEGRAHIHRAGFDPVILAAFAEKYDGWDVLAVWPRWGARVILEVTVTRWLLSGTAQ